MNFTEKIGWLGLALLAFAPIANGQSHWTISAAVAPLYGHTHTEQELGTPGVNGQINSSIISSQGSQSGYRLGLMGHYHFSDHWSLATGLWMSYRKADAPNVQASPAVDYISYPSHSQFYQLPLLVNYQLTKRRLSPYFSAGMLATFRSKIYLMVNPYQEFIVQSSQKAVTFQPTLGAGVLYGLSKHISLVAQPMISGMLPDHNFVVNRSYTLSLQTQLLYRF